MFEFLTCVQGKHSKTFRNVKKPTKYVKNRVVISVKYLKLIESKS